MSNESQITGNQNVVVQQVTDSTIIVNINGRQEEISSKLDEFQKYLQKIEAQWLKFGEETLKIENLKESDLNVILGKKHFNELLIKRTFESIVPYLPRAKNLWQEIENIPQWEIQKNIIQKVTPLIINNFVGPIGLQLQRLFAIGTERLLDDKVSSYISQCTSIVKRSLELVIFALISKLWDEQRTISASFPPSNWLDCGDGSKKLLSTRFQISSMF